MNITKNRRFMVLGFLGGMVAGIWVHLLGSSSDNGASEKHQQIADLQAERDRLKRLLRQQSGEYEEEVERLRREIANLEAELEKSKSLKARSGNRVAQGDDLTEIKGIGKVLAAKLREVGIDSYAQLAALTESEVASLEEQLDSFPGRIHRDDWVGQAKELLG